MDLVLPLSPEVSEGAGGTARDARSGEHDARLAGGCGLVSGVSRRIQHAGNGASGRGRNQLGAGGATTSDRAGAAECGVPVQPGTDLCCGEEVGPGAGGVYAAEGGSGSSGGSGGETTIGRLGNAAEIWSAPAARGRERSTGGGGGHSRSGRGFSARGRGRCGCGAETGSSQARHNRAGAISERQDREQRLLKASRGDGYDSERHDDL